MKKEVILKKKAIKRKKPTLSKAETLIKWAFYFAILVQRRYLAETF